MVSDFLESIELVMQHWYSITSVGVDRIQQLFLPYKISSSATVYDKPLYSNLCTTLTLILTLSPNPHGQHFIGSGLVPSQLWYSLQASFIVLCTSYMH